MRILLTGAAGFLGSHLSESLIGRGYQVTGLDDLSTGSLKNLRNVINNSNFNFIKQDVRDIIHGEFDAILNFACPASPVHYQSNPVKTIETNFLGTINLLRLSEKNGSRLIQASTSEVYGDPQISPQSEDYWGNVNPVGIRSCYDEGKRAAETLCFDYKRQFKVDARVIRIFNSYGPNMAIGDGRVVSNFIVQALTGRDITIYGDGNQTRSFCFVSDLVAGIMKIMDRKETIQTPINLGNPIESSMIEIAKKVISMTNSQSRIINLPLPQDDPSNRCPDISLATKILDWHPVVQLEDGLNRTIEYFRQELS